MDTSIDTSSRTALDSDFKSILRQITQTVQNAQFDGANLLDGSLPGNLKFLANADANSYITLLEADAVAGRHDHHHRADRIARYDHDGTNILGQLSTSISLTNQALGSLGSQQKQLEGHSVFVGKLTDVLNTGVGNLVDADLAKESARLQALQVQQQLGAQALSIANSAPQSSCRCSAAAKSSSERDGSPPLSRQGFRWGRTEAWAATPGPFSIRLTSCQPMRGHDRDASVCSRVNACP